LSEWQREKKRKVFLLWLHENDRASHFQRAVEYYNVSTETEIYNVSTWLGKGFLTYLQDDYDTANNYFSEAIHIDSKHPLPYIGRAKILFQRGKYLDSAKMFRLAITNNPSLPAYVRLGLAYCYVKMDDLKMARKSFERVKQLVTTKPHTTCTSFSSFHFQSLFIPFIFIFVFVVC
jgi:tetratricopeptide (TPR) repeat protein